MYTNELLEEVWAIREQMAREADYDIEKHFNQLREWAAQHPPTGPVLRTQEEVRHYLDHGELPTAAVAEYEARRGAK